MRLEGQAMHKRVLKTSPNSKCFVGGLGLTLLVLSTPSSGANCSLAGPSVSKQLFAMSQCIPEVCRLLPCMSQQKTTKSTFGLFILFLDVKKCQYYSFEGLVPFQLTITMKVDSNPV